MNSGETQLAVVVTPADRRELAELEHAWHMMRSYLVDCAAQKEAGSKRRTQELNGVIRACVERLAVDRRNGGPVPDVQGATDFFGHSYFVSNPRVSADMTAMLRYGSQANDPGRPLEQVAGPFWRVPPDSAAPPTTRSLLQ